MIIETPVAEFDGAILVLRLDVDDSCCDLINEWQTMEIRKESLIRLLERGFKNANIQTSNK